jgi:hypothetical protein
MHADSSAQRGVDKCGIASSLVQCLVACLLWDLAVVVVPQWAWPPLCQHLRTPLCQHNHFECITFCHRPNECRSMVQALHSTGWLTTLVEKQHLPCPAPHPTTMRAQPMGHPYL